MADIIDFSDRYDIVREIGAGGMARVFLARDLKHDRHVAIKVLRPELQSGVGQARFIREIMFAARLSHPHILPLFDSGESDGLLYFVMPFVDGPSLRVRLQQEGRIPLDEAVEITRNVASALDYAHRQGVVHRDIKPENIMIHDGVAMVTDFGIGKALSHAAEEHLTQVGAMIGTPAYMSPEQIAGDANVDGRSDIYSLACVFYEVLSGKQPFSGQTPEASLSVRFTKPPPDVSTLDGTIPSHVATAIRRALAPLRDDRYATGADFVTAITSRTFGAVGGLARTSDRPSVAVLPFANMSADPDNEFFSDGVTEEIINALMHIKSLHVAARTSSFAFKGKDADIIEIGSRLNVRSVLEGSVRRAGSRVRITAQLINVADGYNLWSERYDREMNDVFAIQDEIAATIADRLKVTLTDTAEQPPLKHPTDDVEAYQLYLRGRYLWNRRTKEGLERAVEYFTRAIERDPTYALAYAGLADAYLLLGSYMLVPREEAHRRAKEAADRALELDESIAEAHTSRGQVLRWDLDWEGEEREYQRAIALNPGYATAHQWYAGLLSAMGRHDEALGEIQRAAELDPLSHAISNTFGMILFLSGRYEEAVEQFLRTLELEPEFLSAHALLAVAEAGLGRGDEAMRAVEKVAALRADHPYRLGHRALVCALLGRTGEAQKLLEEMGDVGDPGLLGMVYASVGEVDRAFALLNRAFDENAWWMLIHIKSHPAFDSLRSDPRYRELLERIGLPVDER